MKKILFLLCTGIILSHQLLSLNSLRAQSCDTITSFPWHNDFATGFNCWTQSGAGEWTVMNNGQYVRASVSGTSGSSALLVSQPLTLNTGLMRLYWKERRGNNTSASSNLRVSILVSTDSTFASADTVYSEMANMTNTFVPRNVSLAAYTGQTIRLAVSVQMTTSARYMHISDVELYSDGMPIGTLSAPGYTTVGDITVFSVDLQQGDSSTLTCTWNSSLLNSSWTFNGVNGLNDQVVYPVAGTDTVSVTVATDYGSFTQSAVVNVVECNTVSTFPWVEPFEYNGSYNACWTVNGFTHNTPGISYSFTDDDGQYVTFTDYLQCNGGAGSYLITPAITLPADASDMVFMLRCYNIGNAEPLRVLVSHTAATDTALFTDTIGQLVYGDNRKLRKLSLAAYAGQTIRIAIIHSHTSALRVLYAGVDYDTLPVIGSVTVPSLLSTNFPKLCTAALRFGSTSGLHYTWTSAAGGTFTTNALGDSAWVSYLYGGMTDTITVVATNAYGSDTVSRTALVVDCNPATSLPWSEEFEDGLVCWQQPEGSNWITRKWTTTYMLSLLRNKGNVLCSNINQDSVYDMIVSKPVTLAGTVADNIRLHWLAGTNTALFPHSYWVLITTDDPMSDTCTYDTLYSAVSHIFGSNNVWDTLSVSLAAYAGQTVHIAFYNHPNGLSHSGTFVDLYIDDVDIRTTSAPRVTLAGPTEVNSLDTVTYTALLTEGDTNGLTFAWHSSLLDSTITLNANLLTLNYPLGGTDTVTVVAANVHGADTATLLVTVHDCVIGDLPYFEVFNNTTAVSYDAAGGKVPSCWHRYWNGGNINYAPHVINNYYQNTAIRSRVLNNPALVLMAGTDEGYDSVAMVESPYFADPLAGQILSLWYMQERSDRGTLSVGYLADSGFVSVAELEGQQTGRSVTMRLNSFPPNAHRFALRWERSGVWYGAIVDSIQLIAADSMPTVHITAPAYAHAFDTTLFQACLTNGDTTGLTYTWHSSLLDTTIVTRDTTVTMVYPLTGVDTVSVVATNAHGSDTAWHMLTIVGEPGGFIIGPTAVYTDDSNLYTARLIYGVDSNVTFSWHSTMAAAGNAAMTAVGDCMHIVYLTGGTDTITLTTTNVLGSTTTTRTVTVTGCHITTFPWTEGFENGTNGCWRLSSNADGSTHWQIRNEYYASRSGSHHLYSPFRQLDEDTVDAWFIMQPVDVPAGNPLTLSFYVNFVGNPLTHTYPRLTVLASTTGNSTAQFTDTLYTEQTITLGDYEYAQRSISLAAYAGQSVRIAFVHERRQLSLGLDDISIDYSIPTLPDTIPTPDTVWHEVTVVRMFENEVIDEDSLYYQVTGAGRYRHGDTATLTAYPYKCPPYFSAWIFENGDTIYGVNPYSFVVTSDTLVTALFLQGYGIDGVPDPKFQVSLSPNPSHGDVTISLTPATAYPAPILTVLDLTGRTVVPPTPLDSEITLHDSQLPPGVYIVNVSNGTSTVVRKLVVE